jgi:hypothetical protein
MEHGDLTDRLRQMGRTPVDPDLASRHIGMLATTQPASGRPLARVAVVAMACLVLLAAPAAALVAAAGDDDPDPIVPAEAPDEAPDAGDETGETGDAEFSCTGPPPFAGEPAEPADPDNGVVPSPRAEEAHAFEAWREANCPADEDEDEVEATESTTVPDDPDAGEGNECNGQPPWAGEPATPADPGSGQVPSERAEEAHDRNEDRRECREAAGSEPGGPPAGEPGGPPTDGPAGPPDDPGNGNGNNGEGSGNGAGNGQGGDHGQGNDGEGGRTDD